MFSPNFRITPATTQTLTAIEADRQAVAELPIDVAVLASLRESARLSATHYSTQIEGNRLTQEQVKEVVAGTNFPGRERDEAEVRHHYQALEMVERLGAEFWPLAETTIKSIAGMVMRGRMGPLPYRDGQNVIRDSRSGGIVYLPPEAKDVAGLMKELVEWINGEATKKDLPGPLIAGLAHYQFATIHPYYDGNGRTARLLATLILRGSGYGLKGIYSLDEYYARNLARYYEALTAGPSHNYYLGRAEADVTGFVEYFCRGMAEAFGAVRRQAESALKRSGRDMASELRRLDPRERRLLELFVDQGAVTSMQIAAHLGLSRRTVIGLCRHWVGSGFLRLADASRKRRLYGLGPSTEAVFGQWLTMRDRER